MIFKHKHEISFFHVLVVDDVFVRKDLLTTKYTFVNFPAAEEYKGWCSDFSKCDFFLDSVAEKCINYGFSQILAEISEK